MGDLLHHEQPHDAAVVVNVEAAQLAHSLEHILRASRSALRAQLEQSRAHNLRGRAPLPHQLLKGGLPQGWSVDVSEKDDQSGRGATMHARTLAERHAVIPAPLIHSTPLNYHINNHRHQLRSERTGHQWASSSQPQRMWWTI